MKNDLNRMYGIGLMAFILFLSTLVGAPVLPQLSMELGAGATEIPIVVSAALATVVVVQFFTGILADRYSKRRLILIGALIGSISSLLCAVAAQWTQLAVLRVAGGIADAIAMPALLSITATLGKEQPGRFFGILRSSQGLSFVIGPAVGGALSFVSLRTPFIVDSLLSLVAFLVAVVLVHDTDRVKAEHDLSVLRGLGSIFSDRRVFLYLLMGISGLFGFGILSSFVPTQAQLLGLAPWQIGVILSGGAFVFSLMSYLTGIVSDKSAQRWLAIASQVIIVIASLGLVAGNSFVALTTLYWLFCVGETITYLLCFVYAANSFDPRYMGASMGAFDSLMDLSLFIGPLIAISTFKSTGQIAPVFLMVALPAVLAFFATVAWLPGQVQAASPISND
jgi:MFS family permease